MLPVTVGIRDSVVQSVLTHQRDEGGGCVSGAAVRQLVVFQSRPVSRLRYTQLGVLARLLTRTSPRGGSRVGTLMSQH